jgi:beta-glucanase (GH16 family)
LKIKATGGGYWHCAFDDEFSGPSLDTSKWTAMDTAGTPNGFHQGPECYRPGNVAVSNGALLLTAGKSPSSFACGPGFSTPYTSGMITTLGKYSQTDGLFEMRAKFPPGVGFQPAFWMLPVNPNHNGQYSYGEIDIVEAYGSNPGYVSPHLHYVTTPGDALSGANCYVLAPKLNYHVFQLRWSATQMKFTYDGVTCWQTSWQPAPPYAAVGSVAPTPFDQPFYIMVELALSGPQTPTNQPNGSTPFPSTMTVDYVRAWD